MQESEPREIGNERLGLPVLVARRHRELFSYAVFLSRSVDEAEDLLQDGFARLARKRSSCTVAYAMRTLRNLAIDRTRRRETESRAMSMARVFEAEAAGSERETVREAMQRLPDDEAEVLLLSAVSGLSVRATASVLGRPVGTVAGIRRRGLRRLAECLGDSEAPGDG